MTIDWACDNRQAMMCDNRWAVTSGNWMAMTSGKRRTMACNNRREMDSGNVLSMACKGVTASVGAETAQTADEKIVQKLARAATIDCTEQAPKKADVVKL